MPHLFNLGLYQKRIGGNHIIAAPTIHLGNTKGAASSTRMYNFCRQRSKDPSQCIYPFTTNYQIKNYKQYA